MLNNNTSAIVETINFDRLLNQMNDVQRHTYNIQGQIVDLTTDEASFYINKYANNVYRIK